MHLRHFSKYPTSKRTACARVFSIRRSQWNVSQQNLAKVTVQPHASPLKEALLPIQNYDAAALEDSSMVML